MVRTLAHLSAVDQATFPEVLSALHAAKYTGPITFHFQHGVPYVVDAPPAEPPTKIRLVHPART